MNLFSVKIRTWYLPRAVSASLALATSLFSGYLFGNEQDVLAALQSQVASTQLGVVSTASALENITAAHEVVEQTTVELLKLVNDAKLYIDQDEPRFYTELGDLLKNHVDFDAFARAVMGKYASSKRLASLSVEEQGRLEQQMGRFSKVFTGALINTYGKGLLVFEGERIEVLPPKAEAEKRAITGKASVKQLIYGERETPYEIYYSLRRNQQDIWKIRNMIIESSNLGKIYRNQFDNAYKVYEGNIDKVIDNWTTSSESEVKH